MFIYKKILVLVFLLVSISSYAETAAEKKEVSKQYTAKEVSTHNTKKSCWVIIDKKVFDVTSYLNYHPAPHKVLFNCCGKDCTARFKDKFVGEPHSKRAKAKKDSMIIGTLKETKK